MTSLKCGDGEKENTKLFSMLAFLLSLCKRFATIYLKHFKSINQQHISIITKILDHLSVTAENLYLISGEYKIPWNHWIVKEIYELKKTNYLYTD